MHVLERSNRNSAQCEAPSPCGTRQSEHAILVRVAAALPPQGSDHELHDEALKCRRICIRWEAIFSLSSPCSITTRSWLVEAR